MTADEAAPPVAEARPVEATLHGVTRVDPYQWLKDRKWQEVMVDPSLLDPEMAPPGKHVMTCFVQYAPYHLKEGSWDEHRDALGDAVIDALADHISNIREIIIGRQVMTPLDIERTAGITGGNIFHGELRLSQLLFSRPAPGLT